LFFCKRWAPLFPGCSGILSRYLFSGILPKNLMDFAQVFRDFARIFDESKVLGRTCIAPPTLLFHLHIFESFTSWTTPSNIIKLFYPHTNLSMVCCFHHLRGTLLDCLNQAVKVVSPFWQRNAWDKSCCTVCSHSIFKNVQASRYIF